MSPTRPVETISLDHSPAGRARPRSSSALRSSRHSCTSYWAGLLVVVTMLSFDACDGVAKLTTNLPADPPAVLPNPPSRPVIPEKECEIDLVRWGIYADETHAVETTDGINAAIADAVSSGCGRVRLPFGTYLIGRELDTYRLTGIQMKSDMAFVLDPGAVLQIVSNNKPYYCGIDIDGVHNVEVSGGEIRGDRTTHNFDNPQTLNAPTHEFGHLIYIRGGRSLLNSDIVYVHDITLHEATGDGMCIGAHGDGESITNITITGNKIFDNRRQGISIGGGSDVLIENNEIHHIGGTAPQFGIDIESVNRMSGNVVIRNNQFHDNKGGDLVADDGTNIWFEGNTCEQGTGNAQTAGPVVYNEEAQITIRNNTISMETGSSNGRLGIIEYNIGSRATRVPIVIDGNTLNNCGIMVTNDAHIIISDNRISNYFLLMKNLTGLVLTGNSIETTTTPAFLFDSVSGRASDNKLNGATIEFPLTIDQPYSN
jgi:poly(beta-D-mannuronate) C5 epimerase